MKTRRSSLRSLGLVGFLLTVLVVVETQLVPALEGSVEPALIPYGPWSWVRIVQVDALGNLPSLVVSLALASLIGMVALYVAGIFLVRNSPYHSTTLALILVITFLAASIVTASPPTRKADLLYYTFQGRMIAKAGLNPYLEPPRSLASDPWFPTVSPVWRDLTTGYGPVWLLIASGVDTLVDRSGSLWDLGRAAFGLRALFVGLTLANTLLIALILESLAPERRLAGAIAYAWNPAVLVVGLEHNDTVMLFLALFGIWLHLRGARVLSVASLTGSVLIKYFTAPLLVCYLIWRLRDSRESRVRRGALIVEAALLSIVALLPFNPLATIRHFPTYLVESGRLDHLTDLPFEFLLALAIVAVLGSLRLSRLDRLDRVLQIGTLALFAYLAFMSRDWFPWYVVSAIGLAALLGGWWLDVAGAAGVAWLLDLHQGSSYVAAIAQRDLALPPPRTVEAIVFIPSLVVVGACALWRWRSWSARALFGVGLAALLIVAVAMESPLLTHFSDAPPQADLGGGRAPGPVVFGTTLEWDDWSWQMTVEQIGTPIGPLGPRSLCLERLAPSGAFYAHHPGFSTQGYRDVTFYLGPRGSPTPPLTLAIRGSQGETLGLKRLDSYVAAAPQVGGWRQVRVPLRDLGVSDTTVTGVLLQSASAGERARVCVQGLGFD